MILKPVKRGCRSQLQMFANMMLRLSLKESVLSCFLSLDHGHAERGQSSSGGGGGGGELRAAASVQTGGLSRSFPLKTWSAQTFFFFLITIFLFACSNVESAAVTSRSWKTPGFTPSRRWPTRPRRNCSTLRASAKPRRTRFL